MATDPCSISASEEFDPASYWEARLGRTPNLRGTGHRRFSLDYNRLMYRVATRNLLHALESVGVSLTNKTVLDIGPGFGYFVREYLDWGASQVTGIELTAAGCQTLRGRFPEHEFVQGDISDVGSDLLGTFDLVSAISVVYHIVDDGRFERALNNMCSCVRPEGHLLVVDSFQTRLFPSARHARMRSLRSYDRILTQHGLKVEMVSPMYYFMGRTLVPVLGPAILGNPRVARFIAGIEAWLSSRVRHNAGGLKYMIARKTQDL